MLKWIVEINTDSVIDVLNVLMIYWTILSKWRRFLALFGLVIYETRSVVKKRELAQNLYL